MVFNFSSTPQNYKKDTYLIFALTCSQVANSSQTIKKPTIILYYITITEIVCFSIHKFQMNSEQKTFVIKQEDDQYFLQPILQKLPPKELISQKYSPDIVPQVKLITLKDRRSSNTNFVPPKTKNIQLEKYAENFNVFDFLGSTYAGTINQVVFLKFDNSEYNLVPQSKHKTRIMPAFYVPFKQIYSKHQTTFTKNIGFTFPETTDNSFYPTSKSNKGCSFDPIFCSSYESANLFAAIRKNPFEYDLILQNDVNSCTSTGWFNFSVQFLEEGYYTFKIKNITRDFSKIFKKGMKISYRQLNSFSAKGQKKTGQGWGFCGENITFGQGEIPKQLNQAQKYYQLSFEYRCKNKHEITMFALECPYSFVQAERFYQTVMFKKVKGMTQFQRIQYGKTISGSPLNAYVVRKRKNRGESIKLTPIPSQNNLATRERRSINLAPLNRLPNDIKNKSVVIIGRLGASDVSISYIIQGMMDYLVDCAEYETLKKTIDFYFFPFCNVDGSKYGNDLTNLTGTNLNGNWRQVNKNFNPQVYYLKEILSKIHKENPIALVLSLVPEHQSLFSSILGFKNQLQDSEDSRIFPFVLSKRNRTFSFENSLFFERNSNNSICTVLGETFSNSLCYQFNISHFQRPRANQEKNQGLKLQDEEIIQCTPDSYRGLGKEILSCYLEHVKLYDKNILLRDKWLKQILQIQDRLGKKSFQNTEDSPVQERFNKNFYEVQSLKEIPSLFQLKSFNNIYVSKPKRSIDLNARPDIYLSVPKDKVSFKQLPLAFNDLLKQKRFNDSVMETKTQMVKDSSVNVSTGETVDKPISILSIGQKKRTSIFKNWIPNTLNFSLQSQNKDQLKKGGEGITNKLSKQALKKEISSIYLKKVKAQEAIRKRMTKLGQIINNV